LNWDVLFQRTKFASKSNIFGRLRARFQRWKSWTRFHCQGSKAEHLGRLRLYRQFPSMIWNSIHYEQTEHNDKVSYMHLLWMHCISGWPTPLVSERAPQSHELNAYDSLRNQDITQTGHYLDIDNLAIVNGVISDCSIGFNFKSSSFQRGSQKWYPIAMDRREVTNSRSLRCWIVYATQCLSWRQSSVLQPRVWPRCP
jgi:hypothetical protein